MSDLQQTFTDEPEAAGAVAPSRPASTDSPANGRAAAPAGRRSGDFGHAYHRLLLITDLIAIVISGAATVLLILASGREVDSTEWALFVLAMTPVWILVAYVLGLYGQVERRIDFDYVAELTPIVVASTFWCWLLVMTRGFVLEGYTELITPGVMWVVMMPTLLVCRSAARAIARGRPWYRRSVALVGDAVTVGTLLKRMNRHPEWGLFVGLEVVRREADEGWQIRRPSAEGGLEDAGSIEPDDGTGVSAIRLTELVTAAGIDRALIAGGLDRLSSRTNLAYTMVNRGIAVDYVSGGPESLYASAMLQHLEGMSLMSSKPSYPRPMGATLKRVVDIALSAFLLVLASPVLIVAAIAIRLDSRGPIIFRQPRTGLEGRTFQVCKLRTMVDGADSLRSSLRDESIHGGDAGLFKLKNDPRVTSVGRYLRRSSVDELPQLWNVLVGDMSLVGPRPLPLDETAGIDARYKVRQRVRPGITGPWQVMGRSEIPMEDMLKLDCSYVTGWSLGEDLRILLRTLSAVTGRTGVF